MVTKKSVGPITIDHDITRPIPSRRASLSKQASHNRRFGKLVIISGRYAGKEYQCCSRITLIGRTRENHVVINDTFASRMHGRIERRDGDFIVEDLNSTNGTILNQGAISRAILNHGDKIQIGRMVLQFILEESS